MPRIRYVTEEEATPEIRERMRDEVAEIGHVMASTGIYGHTPTIRDGTRALDAGIGAAGRIAPQLRRLMNVRAATMIGCPF